MAKTKKAAPAIDPLVASLMPESDKKMGAIAGISLVVALAICLWASMYEQVVDEVVFDDSAAADLTASMTIEERRKRRRKRRRRKNPRSLVRRLVAVVSPVVRVSPTLPRLVACSSSSLLRPRMQVLVPTTL